MKITIGTKFRYHYADANPEWEVVKARGRGTWDCVVVDCPDYKGSKKVFSSEEINGSIRSSQMWQKSGDKSDEFFAGLMPGSVVHQRHMGNGYVRCVVTADHKLTPIALVGDWLDCDLPKRQRDGSIHLGYHVKKIQEKEAFRPHASHIYEYNITRQPESQPMGFATRSNPTTMEPISLTVPDMTDEQEKTAELWRKVDSVEFALHSNEPNPALILAHIKQLVS